MAITNHERVGKALDLLKEGLQPFVEREMKAQHAQLRLDQVRESVADTQSHLFSAKNEPQWDSASLLSVMWNQWNVVFRKTLGQAERTLVSELRDVRNRWAHQKPFNGDDAYRALDSAGRLLTAVSAPQSDEIEKMKMELLRVRFDEQVRTEKRKTASTAIESQATGNLKPWREVVNPHKDVASGRYQQAEFAADLWQVHLGEGSDEYRKPVEFFRRTYLTHSLNQMLVGAVQRLGGQGGDPVVQLQTNFGGGKTHSMLALYHLFSDAPKVSWPESMRYWALQLREPMADLDPRPLYSALMRADCVLDVGRALNLSGRLDSSSPALPTSSMTERLWGGILAPAVPAHVG
ncbi:MAG: Swt1 family HEPN domain-containing protein [Candidatus Korobacteraceae bacterium]